MSKPDRDLALVLDVVLPSVAREQALAALEPGRALSPGT